MAVITRSGRGGDRNTSNQNEIVSDEVEVQDDDVPIVDEHVSEVNLNVEVRIYINDNEVETQDDVNPSREHVIDIPKTSLSINVPLVEALEQMPGYAKFMKDLVNKKRSTDCETIKKTHQALCDLGASINLMPYSVFKTLGIGQPRATSMRWQIVDITIKRPLGIIDDVLFRVDKFILLVDFVILDCEVNYKVPIILGRPFLATRKALVDMEAGELTFQVGHEKVVFHVCKSRKQRNSTEVCTFVDLVTKVIVDDTSTIINVEDPLEAVDATLEVLQRRKKAIGWTLADTRGISPAFCMHKIILEDDAKTSVEHQRRLNAVVQEAVKIEVIKWLDAGVAYPISDSSWTSPVQCVPKKGGMTVVTNEQNELITTRIVTGWRNLDKVLARCEETNLVLNWENATLWSRRAFSSAIRSQSTQLWIRKKVIVHTDHEALRYLMTKKDSKAQLMRWVLLLQEFDLEIVDQKGCENQMADQFSRLEEEGRPCDGLEINDSFPDEQLLSVSMNNMPWFADVANFLVTGIVPCELSSNQRKKLKWDSLDYYWDEPYFHHGGARTASKVLSCGFYWPTLYKDEDELVKRCDECQRAGGISKKDEMPLTTILEVYIFDMWGIDFMGPFVSSCVNTYILVAIDYVSKWVEAVALPNNESRSVVNFLKKSIFTRFGTPRAIISDGGSHFSNKAFDTLLAKTNSSKKLDDALWAYRTTYKTLIGMSPYRSVFGKACHLPIEFDHKAVWALRKLNLEWDVAANLRVEQLNELDEFRFHAYSSSSLYKDKMKYLHDKYSSGNEFKVADLVLLFNSRLRLFSGKLKSKWSRPFEVVLVTPFGALHLKNKNGEINRVNRHRVKHYLGKFDDSHVVAMIHLK
ncbi:uncharacterized protein [Nicotiana sylvestris]|uniref:uncharacterized protein n=1 Tax=Nicotiana sylvestris TaxID=4096 RepID=UPI00388C5204